MDKCRAGRHDRPCGPSGDPYGEQCNCGCSPSDWCDEQCQTVTPKNFKQRLERFYALNILRLGRELDRDELEELIQLSGQLREHIKRTTPNFFITK